MSVVSRHSALAPLRERNFRWYFLSRLVNRSGTTMAPIALAFAVLLVGFVELLLAVFREG